ncbi:hypothetical protein ACOSP6_16600 [Tenacibaculum sp. MEBiC06402]|uniref:hypothetical protein n=1 Tax=unclassified Tenacibaculum TaxID=2635139 RepID=UPI003B9ACF67
MKLIDVISNIDNINNEAFLYVKKIENQFSINSETKVLSLEDEELEWKTFEVTERKCPGFDYFMEVFLIKEFINDLNSSERLEDKCKKLIHYVEFDA